MTVNCDAKWNIEHTELGIGNWESGIGVDVQFHFDCRHAALRATHGFSQ